MEEILQIINQYWVAWAPALTAILGIVVAVLPYTMKLRSAAKEMKNDQAFVELSHKLDTVISENKDLIYQNKLLLDQLSHVKNYYETKRKEEALKNGNLQHH